jgi:hypothetical protein
VRGFIHTQNLTRFLDLLESETDPGKLGQIQKLLIEEVDGDGSLAERMNEAEICIRAAQARLRRHQSLLARLDGDGPAMTRAVSVLTTMIQTLNLMIRHRDMLSNRLDLGQP